MSFERQRDASNNIIVPVDGPNAPGNPKRQTMRLEMIGGRRADTDPTVAPLTDVNNFVMLPDGSGMRVRDGFMYTDHYAIRTDPVGRIALMVETAPWNVGNSFRHMAFQTAGGAPYHIEGEHIRDRSQAIGDLGITYVSLPSDNLSVEAGNPAEIEAYRTGNLDAATVASYATRDGTAISGVDYTGETGSHTFDPGDPPGLGMFIDISTNIGGVGKFFFIDIFSNSANTFLAPHMTCVVTIVSP